VTLPVCSATSEWFHFSISLSLSLYLSIYLSIYISTCLPTYHSAGVWTRWFHSVTANSGSNFLSSLLSLAISCFFFFFFFLIWYQGLHIEPLHQPFLFVMGFFEIGSPGLFARLTKILLISASPAARITGRNYQCLSSFSYFKGLSHWSCSKQLSDSPCLLTLHTA
jgi:hypothetical protein